MKHYLLSVVTPTDGVPPAPAEMERIMRLLGGLFPAVRADPLRGPGRTREAASAYDAAADRTRNTAERDFLRRRRRRALPDG